MSPVPPITTIFILFIRVLLLEVLLLEELVFIVVSFLVIGSFVMEAVKVLVANLRAVFGSDRRHVRSLNAFLSTR